MKIEYYEKSSGKIPVLETIGSFTDEHKKKTLLMIDRLEKKEYGFENMLKSGDVKDIKGKNAKGIFELKVIRYRIFFFIAKTKEVFVMLNIFKKQGNKKGYPKQINKASGYKEDWEERNY
jgi:phage-related protein